jgi:phosphatidylcholine synthase
MEKLVVWAVHLLTASGAALAFLAAVAAARDQWQLVFLLLGLAFIVDGIDGPLARAARVQDRLPWFDGASLDFVIDYTTYVFIPAIVLANAEILSEPFATIAGVIVAVVGALYFADTRMKTAEDAFRGFPAVWNAVVYLLLIYKPPEVVSFVLILLFAALTFTPVEFVHPVRVKRLRPLTLIVTAAWALLSIVALAENLDPGPVVRVAFLACSVYLALIGVLLQLTRPAKSQGKAEI